MEAEAGAVEDEVETSGCGGEEDQPGEGSHEGRSEALDESSEVGGRWRRRWLQGEEKFVSHC